MELPAGWKEVLGTECAKGYFKVLTLFIERVYGEHVCYPPRRYIFHALALCQFNQIKVVIIGQDPYHQPGQAHGLAFSVPDGVAFPPSLRNIFKEICADTGVEVPFSGNLTRWASQGVLLLNTLLTVQHGAPASHAGKGWEVFTDAIIDIVCQQNDHVVFMAWGAHAMKKIKQINTKQHLVLAAAHPSPLGAMRKGWFGNKHFSKANAFLQAHGKTPINW